MGLTSQILLVQLAAESQQTGYCTRTNIYYTDTTGMLYSHRRSLTGMERNCHVLHSLGSSATTGVQARSNNEIARIPKTIVITVPAQSVKYTAVVTPEDYPV